MRLHYDMPTDGVDQILMLCISILMRGKKEEQNTTP